MKKIKQLKPWLVPNIQSLAALVLGALAVLAFAPFEFSPLALLSLGGLFWLWSRANGYQQAFNYGLWFGLGLFGAGVSWVFSALYFYSDVPMLLSILLVFGFAFVLSLFPAAAGAIARSFYREEAAGRYLLFVFPASWVLFEGLRSILFGGLPFLLMGTSHLGTWLDGYAPVLGVHGVSFAVAMTAGILVWFIQHKQTLPGALMIAFLWPIGGVLQKTQWVTPVDEPLQVALIQGNFSQDLKWQPDQFWPMMRQNIAMTRENLDADLVVWPETSIPGYLDEAAKGPMRYFFDDARLQSTDIFVGVVSRNKELGEYYNAMVNLRDPEQIYKKRRLVMFGEYYPFPALSERIADYFGFPFSQFTKGFDDQPSLVLGGQPAGVSICFEMMFGAELARNLPHARYFITSSNDAWFVNTLEPAQMRQEVQMRARELGREIVRANNTGYSSIIAADGSIKAEIEPYQAAVLRGEVQPYEGLTPYARWTNWPISILVLTIFALLFMKRYSLIGRLWVGQGKVKPQQS